MCEKKHDNEDEMRETHEIVKGLRRRQLSGIFFNEKSHTEEGTPIHGIHPEIQLSAREPA